MTSEHNAEADFQLSLLNPPDEGGQAMIQQKSRSQKPSVDKNRYRKWMDGNLGQSLCISLPKTIVSADRQTYRIPS